MLLGFFTQDKFLNLAGRGLGQLAEDDGLRHFVARQMLTAVGDDIGLGHFSIPDFQFDEGAGRLAPFFVGLGDHSGFFHSGMAVDGILHFDGRDIFTAGDNDVFRAVLDLDVTVGMPNR